jgi:hypothetical protein
MGFLPKPKFVPLKSFGDVCEDARELGCTIHLFMFGVNSLGARWTAPIMTTLIIRSKYVGLVNQCVTFPIGNGELTTFSLDHKMVCSSTFSVGNHCQAKRRTCGEDKTNPMFSN